MKHKNHGKFISLFALLFLAVSTQFSYSQDTLWTQRYDIPGSIKNAIFSPDDSKILVTGTETFFEVNPENGEMIRELPEFKTGIIAVNPKTNIGINYLCQLVDLNTYKVVKNIIDTSKYKISMYNFTFNSDLSKVAFLNNTYEIGKFEYHQNFVIIDLETGTETIIEKEFGDNEGSGATIAMSPDGKYLATITGYFGQNQDPTDDYRLLSLFDLETNKKVNKLEFPNSQIEWSMKFSPDNSKMAVNQDSLYIYNVPNFKLINKFQFTPTTDEIKDYNFSNDSQEILMCAGIAPLQRFSINKNVLLESYLFLYSNRGIALPNLSVKYTLTRGGIGLYCYVNHTLSIKDEINNETLYPNPSTNQVKVQYGVSKPNTFNLQILDLLGKTIINQPLGFKNKGINYELVDISKLHIKIYNLQIYSPIEVLNFKFIKK